MKFLKIFVTVLIWSYTTDLMGQNTQLRAQLILVSGDTLEGNLIVTKNIFKETLIKETSFNQQLRFINGLNEILRYNWKDVARVAVLDLEGNERVFVQKSGYPRLLEVIYINKVSWYKNFYPSNSSQDVSYEIYDENGKRYSIGIFGSKKNKLESLCNGKDQIISFIRNNPMTDDNILQVLMMYEKELK